MATILILVCLFSVLCYHVLFKKRKEAYSYDLPPSPPSLPLIGHLHLFLSGKPHKAFQKVSSKYGGLIHFRIFNIPVVLVSSASMTNEIYKKNDVNLPTHGIPVVEEGILSSPSSFALAPYGAYWKFMKKLMVTNMLGPQALERSRGIRAKELSRFHSSLLHKSAKKESVMMGEEAMKLSNNIVCSMSMGRSFQEENGEAARVRSLVAESFALFQKMSLEIIMRPLLEKLHITLFTKQVMVASRKFDELLEKVLREHEEKQDEDRSSDMVDVLLAAYQDENAENKITRDNIKAFLADLWLGGTDTTAHAIQWTFAEILSNPNIFQRLREEIDSVVEKTRIIQETDLPNLPYLQATIKEGLRLHPSFPFTPRGFGEGCMIGGFYVPSGTPVLVNVYTVMRDPEYWENPTEFKPERFLASGQESERKEEALKYIAFGAGRRACPASNMALNSLATIIGMMVQGFDWQIQGEIKDCMEEASGLLTMAMARPFVCTPIART